MIIVAYDPGSTTGFCRVDFNRFYNKVTLVSTASYQITESYLCPIDFIDVVLVEQPPPLTQVGSDIIHVFEKIIDFHRWMKIEKILPGQWKPIAKARKWKSKTARNDHEKDAFLMIRWYIFKTFREDIGDL